jgi:glycosyltransferase involved in cell wall biosynthesis
MYHNSNFKYNPKVILSIAIPTRNRPRLLEDLVKIIISEGSVDDIEIVIVDDASTLENWILVEKILLLSDNIKIYRNEQKIGLTANWNKVISFASGKWICFMCDDDMFKSGALDRIRGIISREPRPCLILQNSNIEDSKEWLSPGTDAAIKVALPPASGQIWHRDLTDKLGFYDERIKYCPDAEFWPRLAFHYPVLLVKEYFVIPYQHDTNMMWEHLDSSDFLEQIKLSIEISASWILGQDCNDTKKLGEFVDVGIWETLRTTLNNTFLVKRRMKNFMMYLLQFIKYSIKIERKSLAILTILKLPILRLKDLLRPLIKKKKSYVL